MPAAYLVLHVLGLALALAGIGLACPTRPRLARGVAVGVLALGLPLQLAVLRWPGVVANLLGWPDLVFFSRGTLHLALLLSAAGVCAQRERAARVRTAVLGCLVVGLAAWATPWGQGELALGDFVDAEGVVRQTQPSSCAAAAAATLLRKRDLRPDASEAELARLCLTDPRRGTSDLGLYRGLSLAAAPHRVVFAWPTLAELRRTPRARIVFVGLEPSRASDPELYRFLRDACNWTEGELHAVVCEGIVPGGLGEEPEVALISDPRFGFERWALSHFELLWTGRALDVEPR